MPAHVAQGIADKPLALRKSHSRSRHAIGSLSAVVGDLSAATPFARVNEPCTPFFGWVTEKGTPASLQTFLILLRPVNPSLSGMGTAAEWRALRSPYRGHSSGACRQACRGHRGNSFRQEAVTPRNHASSPVVTAGQPKTISRSDGICQLHGLPRRILEVALTVIANVIDLILRRKQFVV